MRQGFQPLADSETGISTPGGPSEYRTDRLEPTDLVTIFHKIR